MLYYLLFWTILGFIFHFYIIFGTNLLTGGPAQNCRFCLFQSFAEKEYQMESKRNETFLRDFWNKRDPGDLEWMSRKKRGGHEAGRRACPPRRAPTLVGPSQLHRPTSSSYIYSYTPKTSRSTMKPYFHRRNLLYPWDPILGPFPALRWRGHWSRRASTSTP